MSRIHQGEPYSRDDKVAKFSSCVNILKGLPNNLPKLDLYPYMVHVHSL